MAMAPALRGFTLIELMVVLSVMALLMLVAAPLGADWVHSAQTRQARSKLQSGYGLAKALAMRNPCQAQGTESAAVLRAVQADGALQLQVQAVRDDTVQATLGVCATPPAPLWRATLQGGVALVLAGTAVTPATPAAIALDSRGQPLGSTAFSVHKGSAANDETAQLH